MKKSILLVLFIFPILIAVGQDTTYLDNKGKQVNSIEDALYYKVVIYEDADKNRATERRYFKSGQIRSQWHYSNYKEGIFDGKLREWYENGQIQKDIDYNRGDKDGEVLTYWSNGQPKRIDTYKNNELIKGKCMNPDGTERTYFDFEKRPEFPGGGRSKLVEYLAKEVKYPEKSRRKGIEGRVLVSFYINIDGTISDIKITQSVNEEMDKEVIRVVKKMPSWIPGLIDGDPVRVLFILPIVFDLN